MSMREKLASAEARSLIAIVFIVGTFIELPLFAIYAPSFFQNVYMYLLTQLGWILGYYYGAKNGEKRLEMIMRGFLPGGLYTAARTVNTGARLNVST